MISQVRSFWHRLLLKQNFQLLERSHICNWLVQSYFFFKLVNYFLSLSLKLLHFLWTKHVFLHNNQLDLKSYRNHLFYVDNKTSISFLREKWVFLHDINIFVEYSFHLYIPILKKSYFKLKINLYKLNTALQVEFLQGVPKGTVFWVSSSKMLNLIIHAIESKQND